MVNVLVFSVIRTVYVYAPNGTTTTYLLYSAKQKKYQFDREYYTQALVLSSSERLNDRFQMVKIPKMKNGWRKKSTLISLTNEKYTKNPV